MPWPSVDQKRRSERKTFKEATEEGQYLGHNNLWQWPLLVLIYKELSGMVRREEWHLAWDQWVPFLSNPAGQVCIH